MQSSRRLSISIIVTDKATKTTRAFIQIKTVKITLVLQAKT